MKNRKEVKEFLETLHFHGYIDHDISKLDSLIDYYPSQSDSEGSQICKEAVSLFGVNNQLDMAIEECAELIKAINKAKRSGLLKYIGLENIEHPRPSLNDATFKQCLLYNELCGEVADVEIMLDQLKLMLNDDQIRLIKERKLNRLMKNIGIQPKK